MGLHSEETSNKTEEFKNPNSIEDIIAPIKHLHPKSYKKPSKIVKPLTDFLGAIDTDEPIDSALDHTLLWNSKLEVSPASFLSGTH